MFDLKRNSAVIALFLMGLTVLFLTCAGDAYARNKAKSTGKENNKYAALVVDADTGVILHQENANRLLHPASLTKMMTLLMLFDEMKAGRLDKDDTIVISQHAASMVPSKIGLKPGARMRVEDAIKALVTKSANDIAVAVAEHIGRTETRFAKMMTRRAHDLGMSKTVFRNASGLHHPEQVSTARDMGRLGLALVTRYPSYYKYFSVQNFNYRGVNYHNHNRLMQSYDGMDGLKTGYIRPSGFNLVASAKRDGRRLIGVVFGGRTAVSRNARMRELLDSGFAKLKGDGSALVAKAKLPIPEPKPQEAMQAAMDEDMGGGLSVPSRWAMLAEGSPAMRALSGEGDYDIDVRDRLAAGLMAAAAYQGQDIPLSIWRGGDSDSAPAPVTQAAFSPEVPEASVPDTAVWAIQIGAFTSRERTDRAIAESLKRLPANLRSASAVIAPVQTPQGWIFRARLSGYSKAGAQRACDVLPECIPVPPNVQ